MTTLILFFLLSIAASFLCSILEAVLLSVTPSFITQQVQAKTSTGQLLEQYKQDIDRPLSAILTLNTIAHTVGAIGVGAQAGALFGNNSFDIFGLPLSYESIIATVMTLAILVLSEIIPKTIGANNWKKLAGFTVKTLRVLLWILAPFVWISQLITKRLKSDKGKPVLTRADFLAMAAMGESSGVLNEEESTIINNLLNFRKSAVKDIMTPRVVTFMVQEDTDVASFFKEKQASAHSRIPIFGKDKDDIKGLVLKGDLLMAMARDEHGKKVSEFKRELLFVRDELTLPELFEMLTNEKQHLMGVRDEYGNMIGIVSMEDLFETLLGREIVDETDQIIDLADHAKKKWNPEE